MHRVGQNACELLHGAAATRAIEREAATHLPPHTLMARAGVAVARLTQALAPHAQQIWVACGPGNNGGDGLIAAALLHQQALDQGLHRTVSVTLVGRTDALPADAAHALQQVLAAKVPLVDQAPYNVDFAIDALLGIGATRAPEGSIAEHLAWLDSCAVPVLCVDLPSGLQTDSGVLLQRAKRQGPPPGPRHTLSLLTLKPGLFTAQGRDAAGDIWWDDLGVMPSPDHPPQARLRAGFSSLFHPPLRHASHKGSHGEVLIIGGQGLRPSGLGMTGAGILAARAALHSGAGRVYLSRLDTDSAVLDWDPACPELMFRSTEIILQGDLLERCVVVCGCGGGDAVAALLPAVLSRARTLVLDADALNAIATDPSLQSLLTQRHLRGWSTVLTPHPLEAARLLDTTTTTIMADRLTAAQTLSERWGAVCVLKGSGSVTSAPGAIPWINGSGNGALATAGTGDVLAGQIAAALAAPNRTNMLQETVARAVHHHGWMADQWVRHQGERPLNAAWLAQGQPPGAPV